MYCVRVCVCKYMDVHFERIASKSWIHDVLIVQPNRYHLPIKQPKYSNRSQLHIHRMAFIRIFSFHYIFVTSRWLFSRSIFIRLFYANLSSAHAPTSLLNLIRLHRIPEQIIISLKLCVLFSLSGRLHTFTHNNICQSKTIILRPSENTQYSNTVHEVVPVYVSECPMREEILESIKNAAHIVFNSINGRFIWFGVDRRFN